MNYPNPLQATIDEAEDLLQSVLDAGKRLEAAIARERIARARAQDAKESLAAAESEVVVEADALAQAGQGPLHGIAKTSKTYSYALDHMLATARANELSLLAKDADRLAIEADQASIELAQAQAMFSATKAAAELKSSVLRAIQPYI